MSKPDVLVVPDGMIPTGVKLRENLNEPVLGMLCHRLGPHAKFMPRVEAEEDAAWRQIIPYVYVVKNRAILTYERKTGHTDQRLASKLSVGWGGHVEPQDGPADRVFVSVMQCLFRELREECGIEPKQLSIFAGTIVDSSSPVNQVHVGFVFRVELLHHEEVDVKDEARTWGWITVPEFLRRAQDERENWEGWTRMIAKEGMVW